MARSLCATIPLHHKRIFSADFLILRLAFDFDGWQGSRLHFSTYVSDIDHTGALSEAIVSLPREVLPKTTIELEIGYEGVILPDATRLTRLGMPADAAKNTDWDQIGKSFTAVRGIGYVAWYPVGTEAASLSEENSVAETIGRWREREGGVRDARGSLFVEEARQSFDCAHERSEYAGHPRESRWRIG